MAWMLRGLVFVVATVSSFAAQAGEDVPDDSPVQADAPLDPRGAAASQRALAYEEWTARPHPTSEPMRTVIILHGYGGRPEKMIPLVAFADEDVRVIAPRAPLKAGKGSTWIKTFSDADPERGATAQANASMADLVALVARLQTERPMIGKPILVGFSLGGAMTYGLSIFHPELFEQAVILSGPMPPKVIPDAASPEQAALPVRALHGTADQVVRPEGSERSILQMAAVGFDATFQSYPGVGHRVSDDERAWIHELLRTVWPEASAP